MPVPGLMSALAYWDAYRSSWLPANLIMAQRDYFGAHTYERMDEQGIFHTKWELQTFDADRKEILWRQKKHSIPSIFMIFGASGDLTWRKLIPALYIFFSMIHCPKSLRSSEWDLAI